MDLISELPEQVLHHVLYFLAPRDVAKTSILSKAWRSIALSCPYVDLRTEHYFKSTEISFKQYVETTLQNCIAKNLGLQAFKLRIFYYKPEEWDNLIDRWINFVTKTSSRLEEFAIDLRKTKNAPYKLPDCVIFSFNTLIELSLSGFGLDNSRKYCNINLPHLQRLVLCDMDVDDTFVLNFIFSCPLLEKLVIKGCEMLTSLKVSSLQWIKMILIQYCGKLTKVESVIIYDKFSEQVLLILEELKDLNPYVTISLMSSGNWLRFLFSEQCWDNMYVASSSLNNDIIRVFCDEVFDKKTGKICRFNSFTKPCIRDYNLDGVEIERIDWIGERDKIPPLLKPHQKEFYNIISVNLKWQKNEICS
ncbi:F-box/LRR-repeat protein At2g42720 [Ziziphus jujuba]|uniref:F-box/LRR-repeat protein At2g42720 n=1 Tax=Ziziphus jujuba TaxID=326968 RepID=A0A6P3YVV3_ZIZJJ|nr:F-box/LRR-repeat protein At2g42720 [Ziziphus jujuba]